MDDFKFRKMKLFIYIFIFILTFKINSQSPDMILEYEVYYNSYSPRLKNAYLGIYKNQKTVYIETPEYKILNSNQSNFDDTNIDANYSPNGVLKSIEINYKFNKLKSIETLPFKSTIFETFEDVSKINWNTNYNDKKEINNFICYKATTKFRGRKYTAWYSNKFPIRSGPWKFSNTPGLIIEINDETNKYSWILKKISKQDEKYLVLLSKIKFDKSLSLKSFVDLELKNSNNEKDIEKKLTSKLPRNTTVEIKLTKERQSKELIYEWEEEN